ncbi:uncharacterized protein LOC131011914 isoform X1 [Salvia miltiorrhiza]|uniref:uncharacterized protein LOC131011914 isoform X1 n=1 Tax=Salvia miltiorrhiza TaxID=226208 RepID=UPI0025AC3D21|nr:uncharacterized protein LOC131011914 isoform X1 [Salvia miltiorrhiza]
MAAAIGWYGPLIDICKASSYIGDFVQLVALVHKFTPIQYKISGSRGEVVRVDVLVGDETRSYFPVTVWQKQMRSQIAVGHVFLLQNLKITRYGDTVEAMAVHCSSLKCLLEPDDFVAPKGLDKLIGESRLGITVKDKLQKVGGWLQRANLAHCGSILNYNECRMQVKVNWKLHQEICTQDCSSLSDLCQCEDSCKASFHASVGEIFLPNLREPEAERMFISRRLHSLGENSLVDDLITTGCQLCGTPVNGRLGSDVGQNTIPLYCQRSSDRLHIIGTIYRPFLLYVWDDSKYLPISVTNKAAQLLFGNIPAEKVLSSYKLHRPPPSDTGSKKDHRKELSNKNPNFYTIWLILLRMVFQHGKNSPFKFKVTLDTNRDWENGRLEMVSVSLPAFTGKPSVQNQAR